MKKKPKKTKKRLRLENFEGDGATVTISTKAAKKSGIILILPVKAEKRKSG